MYQVSESTNPILPREKLQQFGADHLSDAELLAIILKTGYKGMPVQMLATQLLSHIGDLASLRDASVEELSQLTGIGTVKAIEIQAMIELGKRIHGAEKKTYGKVLGSEDLARQLMHDMSGYTQEHLVALYLNSQNEIIKQQTIFIGTVNSSTANPREILHYGVKYMCTGLIVAHNHPSGNPKPSNADARFTKAIQEACGLVGIQFLDHLVIGKDDYYSFGEHMRI
jgi:DNA repair protein RadC